jgi:hypothetical protein
VSGPGSIADGIGRGLGGQLPFTGAPLVLLALAGAVTTTVGTALRRAAGGRS